MNGKTPVKEQILVNTCVLLELKIRVFFENININDPILFYGLFKLFNLIIFLRNLVFYTLQTCLNCDFQSYFFVLLKYIFYK